MTGTETAAEMADRAAEMLKTAGFELRYVSMKSEACYYSWPGRDEVIRIATHRQNGPPRIVNNYKMVAKLTFSGTNLIRRGDTAVREDKLRTMVAVAIGTYFLRAAGIGPW